MEFNSNTRSQNAGGEHARGSPATLDQETIQRIDHALEGTINADVSKLDPDDKLILLIERYNRKIRELNKIKAEDQ